MKKIMALLLCCCLLLCAACAESTGVNPYMPVEVNAAAGEEAEALRFPGLDFGEGAAFLRFKAVSDSQLKILVYADDPAGELLGTALFKPITKEYRLSVSLSGVHDLYMTLEGSGTFHSFQAFTDQKGIDAAVRAENASGYEDAVPGRYTKECKNGGTVEKFTYQAHDWAGDQALYEKTAYVYLPYGYDPANTYDLLILCHGIGGSEAEWGLPGKDSRVKKIMDNLIDSGEIRPFIVVTPNGRAGKSGGNEAFYVFDRELREDLLPALAASYAVDIANRDRLAMAGLSMGAMQTINIGMGRCLDLFSAFGAFSACPTSNPAAMTAATLNAHKDLPVRCFYSICGNEDDIARASTRAAISGIADMTDQLTDKNYKEQWVTGGHDFGVWYLGFYNFARMIGE